MKTYLTISSNSKKNWIFQVKQIGGESLYVYRDEDNIEESPLEKELLLINTDKNQ